MIVYTVTRDGSPVMNSDGQYLVFDRLRNARQWYRQCIKQPGRYKVHRACLDIEGFPVRWNARPEGVR